MDCTTWLDPLQDRVGIPMSRVFAVVLGTCIAAIGD